MNPSFPIVEGVYRLTEKWSITLPGPFNRRIEDGDLVLWRPGLTMWIAVWGNDERETTSARLEWLRGDASEEAYDFLEEEDGGLLRFSYRLAEESEDDRADALYCFAIADESHVQMAVYFDREQDLETAQALWRSLRSPYGF